MTWADCACCGAAGVIGDALVRNDRPDVTGVSIPRTGRSAGNHPGSRHPCRAFTVGGRQPGRNTRRARCVIRPCLRQGRTLPPIWRHSWVGWLTVPAEPERAFCCIARAIFARGRDLRLGDQRCLRSVAACLCRVRQPGRAHRVQLGDLGEHGLQAYVAGNRLDQRQRLRLPAVGLVIAGGRGQLREPRWRPGRAALSPAA